VLMACPASSATAKRLCHQEDKWNAKKAMSLKHHVSFSALDHLPSRVEEGDSNSQRPLATWYDAAHQHFVALINPSSDEEKRLAYLLSRPLASLQN